MIEIDVEGGTISYLIEEAKDESINNRCIFDGRVLSHAGSTGNFGGSTYAVFSLGWTVSADLTATTYMLTGLSPSTEYLLATRYVTAKGGGEWSPSVTVTTYALLTVRDITSSGFTVESDTLPAGATAWQIGYKRNVDIEVTNYSDRTNSSNRGGYRPYSGSTLITTWAQAHSLSRIDINRLDDDGTDQTSIFQSMKSGDVFEISINGGTIIWQLTSSMPAVGTVYVLRGTVLSVDAGTRWANTSNSPIELNLIYRVPAQVTGTEHIVTGLQSDTQYILQRRYIFSDGPGDWSPSVTATTLAPVPSAPTVTDITTSGFTIESDTLPAGATAWQIRYQRNVDIELMNYSDGSSSLNNGGYRLFASSIQVQNWARAALLTQIDINELDDDGTDQTSIFQSMKSGDVFEISVSGGTLLWQLTSVGTTTQDRYRLRGTALSVDAGSSWNGSSSSPIDLNLTWSPVEQVTGTEHIVTGLQSDTEYIIERRYISADGRPSGWSPAVTVTTYALMTVRDITANSFTIESDTLPAGAIAWQIGYKRNVVDIEVTNYWDATNSGNTGGYRVFSGDDLTGYNLVTTWAQAHSLSRIDIRTHNTDGIDHTSIFQSMESGDVFEISINGGTIIWQLTSSSPITGSRYQLLGTVLSVDAGAGWANTNLTQMRLNLIYRVPAQVTGTEQIVTGLQSATEYILQRRYIFSDGPGDWSHAVVTTL